MPAAGRRAFVHLSASGWLFSFLLCFSACSVKPYGENYPTRRITTGPGPEDFVLDHSSGSPRLLISCDARREDEPQRSGIWSFDLKGSEARELPRIREPEFLVFHPHGIALAAPAEGDSVPALYVISHDDERDIHQILRYRVEAERLIFDRSWTDPLLNSPNAVCVLGDGSILVTNDSGKRHSRLEALLKQRRSGVVAWSPESGIWRPVADRLAYANGICFRGEEVFVATTRQNRVFAFHWTGDSLTERRELAKVPGGDNLRWDGDALLTAAHPSVIAFVRHARSAERGSPIRIWRIPVSADKEAQMKKVDPELLYATDGQPISAAATAILLDGKLYLSQVFDPFILEVELPATGAKL